ncbi:MAG: PilZ domain-containing protein [Nannocystaceae bacterium]|nr:PilZ domain-containing protein [Nannocystaceae bacterium]
MTGENRRARRVKTWFPVRMREGERRNTAVAKDVSAKGILIAARRRFELGTEVHVSLHLDPEAGAPRLVQGRVVRQEPNANDPGGLWPYKLAIEFDQADPELLEAVSAAN